MLRGGGAVSAGRVRVPGKGGKGVREKGCRWGWERGKVGERGGGREGRKDGERERDRGRGRGHREAEREREREGRDPRSQRRLVAGGGPGGRSGSRREACRNRWLRLPPSGREPRPGDARSDPLLLPYSSSRHAALCLFCKPRHSTLKILSMDFFFLLLLP